MPTIDPQKFGGALVLGLMLFFIEKIIEKALSARNKRKQEKAAETGVPVALPGWRRWTETLLHGRSIRKYSARYKQQLVEKLTTDSAHFAPLFAFPMSLCPADSFLCLQTDNRNFTVFEAAKRFSKSGLVILGQAGSGKSTSMRQLAKDLCRLDSVPLLVDLRNYRDTEDTLLQLLVREYGSRHFLIRGLRLGYFTLLLDGMNEIPKESLRRFETDLLSFRSQYPANGVVLTCRPTDYTSNFSRFVHMQLSSLTYESIENYLKSVLGAKQAEQLLFSLDDSLLGLCENPYMLTMLANIYRSTNAIPPNRAKIYESFLNNFLVSWEPSKNAASVSVKVKHDLLSDLAFYMGNRVMIISLPQAETLVAAKLNVLRSTFYKHNYEPSKAINELCENGLLQVEYGHSLSFMHPSIQEYYTALELSSRLASGVMQISEVARYIDDTRWFETLKMLAGLMPDATPLISVFRKANLFLASECIHSSTYVNPKLVDAAIVQAVTEFKFGSVPFNYPLIFSLRRLESKRSSNLSQRVIEDMIYWCNKFASTTPRVIDDSTEYLLQLIKEKINPFVMSDAIWTLGERKEGKAVEPLISILLDTKSQFRADAARALGKIGDIRAVDPLLSCINSEPLQLRPFCFMALGDMRDQRALEPLRSYLNDVSMPYRENAAWALIHIVDESMTDFLVQNLTRGTPRARANFVYLLGIHKFPKGFTPLMELLTTETDAFVKEDIAFALGNYGDSRAIPALIPCLNDSDALVRTRAAEALGKLGSNDVLPILKKLLVDESEFVRESVEEAIRIIEKRQAESINQAPATV